MNYIKAVLLGTLAVLFLGCSSAPKDAVYGMYDALAKGDMKKLNTYATNSTIQLLTIRAAMQCTKNPNDYSDKLDDYIGECMQEVYAKVSIKDIMTVKEDDSAVTVIVTEEFNGRQMKEKMHLAKINGNWKVATEGR